MASALKSNDYCPIGSRIHLAALALASSLAAWASEPPARTEHSYGPLAHDFDLIWEEGRRQEVAGPIFSVEVGRDWERWAVSPFLRYANDRTLDSSEFDVLYPFFTVDRAGTEYKFKLMFLHSFAGGQSQEEDLARRFTVFPLYFSQRSPVPEDNYTAVLPFYGTLKNRLQRDEIHWVMWPLYVETWRKGVRTRNMPWPLVHSREGGGIEGWQFWPFYGRETKTSSTFTNDYGNLEIDPGHRKSFVLWPFYFREDHEVGTTNEVNHRILLPFYSYSLSPAKDSRTWLWPLFSVIDNREKRYKEWQMPWPFIVFARGPGENTDRVLPFYSRSVSPTAQSGFLLWPLYKVNRITSPPLMRERNRILFFLYSNVRETNTLRQTVARRVDLWPFFAYREDHEGNRRFQALALLESFLPLNHAIDHVYSPMWSIWRNASNPTTQASSQSFLWNLYRRDRSPAQTKVSLLFGLFQYQSTPERRRVKLFFIPFGAKVKSASAKEPPDP
jgi:hypothetical protein